MLNEFQIASEASPKIWIAAFLSPDKHGWAYNREAEIIESSEQPVAARKSTGFGLFGYQIVQVNKQEFDNAGGFIGLPNKPVTIFQTAVGRFIFMEDIHGNKYEFSGGKGDGKFYEGMTINRIMDIKLLTGDKIVNRSGEIVAEVMELPKLSKAISSMQISLPA